MNHKRLFPRNERNSHTNIGRGLYTAFLTTTLTASLCLSASAATVWEKANEIMKDVYKQILGISTIAAIVIRDYDNLELKQFLDVAASFILTDDNGLLCDAYNTTELGEEDCTRLFLMDSTQFPAWLAERQNGVKSISDF